MANLNYLKVGNYIKESVIKRPSRYIQDKLIHIDELKIDDKTALVNGRQYQIVGDKLCIDDDAFVITLSEVDKKFEARIKDELNHELFKLENTIHYLCELVDSAKSVENVVGIDHINRIIKEANEKIML